MGCYCDCLKEHKEEFTLKPKPQDLVFKKREDSKFHAMFEKIEKGSTSLFKSIYLYDFVQLLQHPHYEKGISRTDFNVLIHSKFLKLDSLIIGNLFDSNLEREFCDYQSHFYDKCLKAYNNFLKREKYKGKWDKALLPVLFIIPFGILYCLSSNQNKVELIFNLLANEKYEIERDSLHMKFFLYSLLFTASGLYLHIIKGLNHEYEGKCLGILVTDDELISCCHCYEFRDCIRNGKKFIEDFFGDNETLGIEEYMSRICKDEFNWVLDSASIRVYLEEHDDQEPDEHDH